MDNLENRMVVPGPWTGDPNDPAAPEADEPTDTRDDDIAALERTVQVMQRRIDTMSASIRNFLFALDRGYFRRTVKSTSADSTIDELRAMADNLWSSAGNRHANVAEPLRSVVNSICPR